MAAYRGPNRRIKAKVEVIEVSADAATSPQGVTGYDDWIQSNLGIIPADHQQILRGARILFAGTGAEGSSTAICLARLGVGHFRLADIDNFDFKNLNRQFGCYHDTIGRSKVDAVAAEILRINPEAGIEVVSDGVTAENAASLVEDVAAVVLGLDLYAPEAGIALDTAARAAGLHMVAGVSLGFRSDVYVFSPRGMGLVEFCLASVARGEYPYVPTDPPPTGFPRELALTMKHLFDGLPDPAESIEAFLPAFSEKLDAGLDLAIPAIAPTVFLTGARSAIEVYGLLTRTRNPVLAPGYTSIDLMNVVATVQEE
jgi:molybdopterin/thiamine biosynthesis adenylyltransferase